MCRSRITFSLQTFGYTHLSAGDLLRAERQKPDSEVGQMIETHIKNGTIVPVEVTCGLLEQVCKAVYHVKVHESFLCTLVLKCTILILPIPNFICNHDFAFPSNMNTYD